MPRRSEPIADEENPEWTQAMFDRSEGPESLPPEVLAAFPNTQVSGRGETPAKRLTSLRLDRDVVEHFRGTGAGWQARINAILRGAIDKRSA